MAASSEDDSSSDQLVIDFRDLPCASKKIKTKHRAGPKLIETNSLREEAPKRCLEKQPSATKKKRRKAESKGSCSEVEDRTQKKTVQRVKVNNNNNKLKPISSDVVLTIPVEQGNITISTPTTLSAVSRIGNITDPVAPVHPVASTSQLSTHETDQINSVGNFFEQVSTPHESSYRRYFLPSSKVPVISTDDAAPIQPSERKYRFIYKLFPVPVTFTDGQTGFADFQLKIFQQQLRMHVQFAAQNFMQSYAHPKFWEMAKTFKDMLLDLQKMSHSNPLAAAWNLDGAVTCCTGWEQELEKESDENTKFINFQLKETEKSEKAKETSKYYRGSFHPKLMEWVVTKNVFMYPKLLPSFPFRMDFRAGKRFIRAEERLIALGLEIFSNIAKEEYNKQKKGKNATLMDVCSYISKYMLPLHTAQQLYACVSAPHRRYRDQNDPFKYYYTHMKAEPFQHVLERIDFNNVIPPASYQQGEIPDPWDTYIYSTKRLAMLYERTTSAIEMSGSSEPCNLQPQSAPSQEVNGNNAFHLVVDPHQTTIPLEQCITMSSYPPTSLQIDQLLLNESYSSVVDKENSNSNVDKENSNIREAIEPECSEYQPPEIKHELPISIDDSNFGVPCITDIDLTEPEESICCHCNCNRPQENTHGQNRLEKGQKLLTDYFRLSSKNNSRNDKRRQSLKQKLWEIYQRFQSSFEHGGIDRKQLNGFLLIVFDHFCLIESFSCFLNELKGSSNCSENNEDEHSMWIELRTRLHRISEVKDNDATNADSFVQKVEDTLLSDNKQVQFDSFMEICFSFNPVADRITDLYYKIENLMDDLPELVDLFLTFLFSGQASVVAKFFEKFILTNINDCPTILNIFFDKLPTQIVNVYTCLLKLSNESDVSMERIKICILPLLEGNPLLTEWFLLFFPSENPQEISSPDCELLSIHETAQSVLACPKSVSESSSVENCQYNIVSPEDIHPEQMFCEDFKMNAPVIQLNTVVHDEQGVAYTVHMLVPDPSTQDTT